MNQCQKHSMTMTKIEVKESFFTSILTEIANILV